MLIDFATNLHSLLSQIRRRRWGVAQFMPECQSLLACSSLAQFTPEGVAHFAPE